MVKAMLRIRMSYINPGVGDEFFPDPESRIPDPKPIFWELSNNFLGLKYLNS